MKKFTEDLNKLKEKFELLELEFETKTGKRSTTLKGYWRKDFIN